MHSISCRVKLYSSRSQSAAKPHLLCTVKTRCQPQHNSVSSCSPVLQKQSYTATSDRCFVVVCFLVLMYRFVSSGHIGLLKVLKFSLPCHHFKLSESSIFFSTFFTPWPHSYVTKNSHDPKLSCVMWHTLGASNRLSRNDGIFKTYAFFLIMCQIYHYVHSAASLFCTSSWNWCSLIQQLCNKSYFRVKSCSCFREVVILAAHFSGCRF